MTRPVSVRTLAACLFLALTGCGTGVPSKPADTKGSTPASGAASTQAGGTPAAANEPAPSLLTPQNPIQHAAEKFIADLRAAAEKPDPFPPELMSRVSPAFLKAVGKPVLSESDKARGYSADAAQEWLRRAAGALNGVGLPTGYGSPVAAVFVGSFEQGARRFLLRMVPGEGGWKADWFQLGTAKADAAKPTGPDGPFQDFVAQAFLDALTPGPMTRDDRVLLLGALLSSQARSTWAAPGGQDKERGYDFNPAGLGVVADKLGTGLTAYTRTPSGSDQFRVELTRGGATTTYTLKLVKGSSPGEWLVDAFTPQ